MNAPKPNAESVHPRADQFSTTHWSLVLVAGERETPQAANALARLCESYWYPLYAYVRRRGYGVAEAEDLTQSFFARLLEKNYVQAANPERGKFRTFLLTALQHFLSDQRDYARAAKRGGGKTLLSLDFESAEQRYRLEPVDRTTPERLFERRWALTLLERVLTRLEEEYSSGGKLVLFDLLKPCLTHAKGASPYREIAAQAGMSEPAVKTAMHRLRKRYRDLLEREIAETVATAEDAEVELQQLFAALSSDS